MKNQKLEQLIAKAQKIMKKSRDPIHDFDHVTRVVAYAANISQTLNVTKAEHDALILAAWWHDAGRTITKHPSIIVMRFVDDLVSALMLWKTTIQLGLYGSIAGRATRIIFCKSFGTGALFTRLLLRKKSRLLLDILKDADTLDVLHVQRVARLLPMVSHSLTYQFGYRLTIWWFLNGRQLSFKTIAAKQYFKDILQTFLRWIKEESVLVWHIAQFGSFWVNEKLARGEKLLIEVLESERARTQALVI